MMADLSVRLKQKLMVLVMMTIANRARKQVRSPEIVLMFIGFLWCFFCKEKAFGSSFL